MEHYCTNCGADLDSQFGFSEYTDYWECTECGAIMCNPDNSSFGRFPDVVWKCDSCGAILNRQFGFDDYLDEWTCTECGHVNPINESEIYSSEEDYQSSRLADLAALLVVLGAKKGINYLRNKRKEKQTSIYEADSVESGEELDPSPDNKSCMEYVRAKCPSCGKELYIDASLNMAFCQYCGAKLSRKK